jgi:hypothetical protein
MSIPRFAGALCFVFTASLFAQEVAETTDAVANWTTSPYWDPGEAVGKNLGEILLEGEDLGVEPLGALPTAPLPFIAITPCRIVDTRGAVGPFGGPALVANSSRTFNLPVGPCPGLPSDAGAWSLNFTVIGGMGSFQGGFLTAWPAGDTQPTVSTLNFSANQLVANAAVVPAGTSGSINVFVNAPAYLLIDINGYYRNVAVVNAVNSLSGAVTLAAGSNVSITPSGQTLTIASSGGGGGGDITSVTAGTGLTGGGTTADVTLNVNFGGSGSATTASRTDHTHDASGIVSGFLASARLGGTYSNALTFSNPANSFVGAFQGDGSGLTNVWKLSGNAGTTPGTHFLGTTDNQALELKVNGARALRLEPTAGTPNLIGGSSANFVQAASPGTPNPVVGATIGGGGAAGKANRVEGAFGTIGGGINNRTWTGDFIPPPVSGNTVGGGENNEALGRWATVAGGQGNVASSSYSFIGGGNSNTTFSSLAADGTAWATVAGGLSNDARGSYAFIGGGANNETTDRYGVVAGGSANRAGDAAGNSLDRLYASVGGGTSNIASGTASTVPGGDSNLASASYSFAAGRRAKADDNGAFVWGDSTDADVTSTTVDQFLVRASGGVALIRGTSTAQATPAALAVQNAAASGEGAWVWTSSSANPKPVLLALIHPSGTNSFLECKTFDGAAVVNRCHITSAGTFVAGSDFAEALPATGGKEGFEPGDVLVLSSDTDGVERSSKRYDTRAIGVYSTRPAVLGAEKDGETRVDPDDVPVALTGIVPTKVTAENGAISRGDLLTTSSTPGHAMKATPISVAGVDIYPPGTILGKALQPLADDKGVIKMLVQGR